MKTKNETKQNTTYHYNTPIKSMRMVETILLTVNPNSNMFRAVHVPIPGPILRVRCELMEKQHPGIDLQSPAIHTIAFDFIFQKKKKNIFKIV